MDSIKELRERLAAVPLFSRAPTSDLLVIARHAEIRDVPAGTPVIQKGDPGDEFFLLLDGKVQVVRDGAPVAELGPGDYFGELALLDPAPRDADVTATDAATLGVLNRARFRLVLDAVPGVAEVMLACLAHRLREAEAVSPRV